MDNKKEETEQKGNDIAQQEELSEGETDSGEDESEASEEDPKSEDKEVEAAQDTQQACIALYHEAVRDEIQLRAAERHRERWQLPKRHVTNNLAPLSRMSDVSDVLCFCKIQLI